MNVEQFREVVSGRRRGPLPGLLRGALAIAELPYAAYMHWRNGRYDRDRWTRHRVPAVVISVGNLTTGGTGKTPLVRWLAEWFRQQQLRVTILSRGYGANQGARNDEALELERYLPDVPHLQNPDRVVAATTAIEELDAQLLLLDDAFQHRRIQRDLDIVLLDASEPFGYEHVLPRGLLREPMSGLRRADVVVLSRADMATDPQRAAIRQRVAQLAPQAAWIEVIHQPRQLISHSGQTQPLESLSKRPVLAFCGIGNPDGFAHTLEQCGYEVLELKTFPDHHAFDRDDIDRLRTWVDQHSVDAVLCTHKDLVKIGIDQLGSRPLFALDVGIEIVQGKEDLEPLLTRMSEKASQRR